MVGCQLVVSACPSPGPAPCGTCMLASGSAQMLLAGSSRQSSRCRHASGTSTALPALPVIAATCRVGALSHCRRTRCPRTTLCACGPAREMPAALRWLREWCIACATAPSRLQVGRGCVVGWFRGFRAASRAGQHHCGCRLVVDLVLPTPAPRVRTDRWGIAMGHRCLLSVSTPSANLNPTPS